MAEQRMNDQPQEQAEAEREPFDWEAWLEEGMRGRSALAEDMGEPPAFLEHSCAAQREARLAMKSLFGEMGECLARMGRKMSGSRPSASQRGERIPVQ